MSENDGTKIMSCRGLCSLEPCSVANLHMHQAEFRAEDAIVAASYAVLDDLSSQLENLNKKCEQLQKQGLTRTHSQFCGNYRRSEHIQALHARAQAYANSHKL
jgi:TolA-binding protein